MKPFLWSHLPAFPVCCLPGPPAHIPLSSFSFCAWRPPVKSAGREVEVMGSDPWSSLDWGPRRGEDGDSAGALKQTKSESNRLHEGKDRPKMSAEQTYLNVASFSWGDFKRGWAAAASGFWEENEKSVRGDDLDTEQSTNMVTTWTGAKYHQIQLNDVPLVFYSDIKDSRNIPRWCDEQQF